VRGLIRLAADQAAIQQCLKAGARPPACESASNFDPGSVGSTPASNIDPGRGVRP
jgi:hypothetical protein